MKEALKLALEALERGETKLRWEAITAIKEALAQPERDPWREAVAQPKIDPWRGALAQPEQDDRRLQIAMRQWEDWKTYALELQKKLVKYEGGSPMILNTQPEQNRKCRLCGEDQSFTGTCGGGKENPTALCFTPPQPVQEPVAWEQFHEHLVERNFCPRCGKRLASGFVEISIHTCTPPKEKP